MADAITIKALQDASLDAKSLEEVVNGNESKQVTTRLGENYPSVKKAIKTLFENGGLPATPFTTKALMTASTLTDGQYAMVTDDTDNNGLYLKSTGAWVKSSYDVYNMVRDSAHNFWEGLKNGRWYAKPKKIYGTTTFKEGAGSNLTTGVEGSTQDSYVYVMDIEPNTTYTIYSQYNRNNPHILFYNTKPESWGIRSIADSQVIKLQSVVIGVGRYYTFKTGSETKYLVYDPIDLESDKNFHIITGDFTEDNWRYFKEPISLELQSPILLSHDINKSKNLAPTEYRYSVFNDGKVALNTYSANARGASGALTDTSIGMSIPVEPDTLYTISKEPSDRFSISLSKKGYVGGEGTIVFRNSGVQQHTLRTGVDDVFMFIYLSNTGQEPLVQVEKGDEVTSYKSPLNVVDGSSVSSIGKLTDIGSKVTQADGEYLDLGYQTDMFRYPVGDNGYTAATVIDNLYEPLRADYPHLISRSVLSKDSTGTYDIYEYIFEPDDYEQTIFLSVGMHGTEVIPPFSTGVLLNEIYRNPSKHEGLAYLRNRVKIIVIPVVNPWGLSHNPKLGTTSYLNPNGVNPSRNFPSRWEVNPIWDSSSPKGTAPLSEVETRNIYDILNREKDTLAFYLDNHTGQSWVRDSMFYYLKNDNYLRPIIDQIVSYQSDKVRSEGREPILEVNETARATQIYYPFRVHGIPSAVIEFGAGGYDSLGTEEMSANTNQLFNILHYALKAKLKDRRNQDELNEHNKQFISLYNTLAGHNEKINEAWRYTKWQTEMYDKLGLTRSVIGAASGGYDLIKYTHEPSGYTNTIVLSAGLRGAEQKSVTELGFFAYKLMTDKNPQIVALRDSTRFIFIPMLNPWGFDNNKNVNANTVAPYADFATSTEPESVALRAFIDSESIDLYVDIDSTSNATKPSGYADCQVIYNAKANSSYQAMFNILNSKYGVSPSAVANSYSGSLVKSAIANYINNKGIAYEYAFFTQNILPKHTAVQYVDYGYEANELAYCTEVLLNSIASINQKITLTKYLAI